MNSLVFLAFMTSHGGAGHTARLLPGAIHVLPWTVRRWSGVHTPTVHSSETGEEVPKK